MNSISNKEVFDFPVVQPAEVVSPENQKLRDINNLNNPSMLTHPSVESSDLLSLSNPQMLSPGCSVHEMHPSSDILGDHLSGSDLDNIISDQCKNLVHFSPQDYDYNLTETGLIRTSYQKPGPSNTIGMISNFHTIAK